MNFGWLGRPAAGDLPSAISATLRFASLGCRKSSNASFTPSLGGVADGKFPLTQWSVIALAQKSGDSTERTSRSESESGSTSATCR